MSTLARQLEETFLPILAAALNPTLPALYSLRFSQQNPIGAPLPLPAVVLSAGEEGINSSIRAGGRAACDLVLRATCRVNGDLSESAAAIEALAESVRVAIETATISSGWLFLQLHPLTDVREFQGSTRVVAKVWKVIALPSV